jgi:hypothetical protein
MTPAGNTSGTVAPTYRANSGNPYVDFDGTTNGLGVAGYLSGAVKTFVMVYRHPGTGGSIPSVSGSAVVMNQAGTLVLTGNTGGAPAVTITANVWHVVAGVVNGNSSFTVVDGVKSSQTPANVTGTMTKLRLGRDASSYCKFNIAEFITYSDAKSEANIATIRTALQAAYSGLGI